MHSGKDGAEFSSCGTTYNISTFSGLDEDYRYTHPGLSMNLKQRNKKITPNDIKKTPPKIKDKKTTTTTKATKGEKDTLK